MELIEQSFDTELRNKTEFKKSRILLQECSEEELQEISGGGGSIKIKPDYNCPAVTILSGGFLTIFGLIMMAVGILRGNKDGYFTSTSKCRRPDVTVEHVHYYR